MPFAVMVLATAHSASPPQMTCNAGLAFDNEPSPLSS